MSFVADPTGEKTGESAGLTLIDASQCVYNPETSLYDPGETGFDISSSCDVVVDGFHVTGAREDGIRVDENSDGAIIRNNSIYFATYNANNTAIQANAEGTGHQVVSNLIYFGGSGSGSTSCFRTGATTSFAAFGNNLCYTGGGASLLQGLLSAVGSGLTGTITGNPLLVALPSSSNGWSMAIQSTSPARDAGALSLSSLVDKTLGSRDSKPDIGAFEYRGTADTVAPGVPTNVQLQ